MKKEYIAPDVTLTIHGTLESVFASGVVCGRDKVLSNWLTDSGDNHKPTLKAYCKDATKWMVKIDNDNLYGIGDLED